MSIKINGYIYELSVCVGLRFFMYFCCTDVIIRWHAHMYIYPLKNTNYFSLLPKYCPKHRTVHKEKTFRLRIWSHKNEWLLNSGFKYKSLLIKELSLFLWNDQTVWKSCLKAISRHFGGKLLEQVDIFILNEMLIKVNLYMSLSKQKIEG